MYRAQASAGDDPEFGPPLDLIIAEALQRRSADSPVISQMIDTRDRYNGDIVTPLGDVKGKVAMNRPGPNFFIECIDGAARAGASRLPKITCPTGPTDSDAARARADTRQTALYGNWYFSQLDLKLHRAFRHLVGYGTTAMVVVPDERAQRAKIEVREPLTAYPELRAPDDVRSPKDVVFLYARSAEWIKANYPTKAPDYLANASGKGWQTLWNVLEWVDEECIVIAVMGPRFPPMGYADAAPFGYGAFELDRYRNLAGCVPVVCPRRVTLDRIQGQLAALTGYSDLYAKLMALEITATEKAIFPDMVLMSKNGLMPQLSGNKWKDGRSGEVNLVTDSAIEVIGKTPGPSTMPMLQEIGMHIRSSGSVSPLYGGNAAGMRTGAGVDALGDVSINPMVAETQTVMARMLEELNSAVMKVEKGYFGDKSFTVVLGLGGSDKSVTYTPNKDFDFTETVVSYPIPGASITETSVALAQLESTKMMSRRTARHQHPMIADADVEEEQVDLEQIHDAVLAKFGSDITSGGSTLLVAARAQVLMEDEHLTLARAVLKAESEQSNQGPATGAPGGPPAVGPDGQPIPPEMAQALGQPGGAGPAGAGGTGGPPPPIPGPAQGLVNLRHVIQGVNASPSPSAV
jgi:hypothetical protein